uniref:Geminin n=1 Tax=Ditylenchus dipsaci TaxID=166011 RepID=A0A915EFZ2_9BILA
MSFLNTPNLAKPSKMFNFVGIYKEKFPKKNGQEKSVLLTSSSVEEERQENKVLQGAQKVHLDKKYCVDKDAKTSTSSDIESASTAHSLSTKDLSNTLLSHRKVKQGKVSNTVPHKSDHSDEPKRDSSADVYMPSAPSLATAHHLLEEQNNWRLLLEYIKRQKQLEDRNEKLAKQLAELVLELHNHKQEISKQAEQLKKFQQIIQAKEIQQPQNLSNGTHKVNGITLQSQANLLEVDSSDDSF